MCLSEQEQNESLDFILSEACSREGLDKPQLVLAGATLPKEAQLQGYVHKVPAVATYLLSVRCPQQYCQILNDGVCSRTVFFRFIRLLFRLSHMWHAQTEGSALYRGICGML